MPVEQVGNVLDAFAEKYLVNSFPLESAVRSSKQYELMHEHLVHILSEAPDPTLQKALLRLAVPRDEPPSPVDQALGDHQIATIFDKGSVSPPPAGHSAPSESPISGAAS